MPHFADTAKSVVAEITANDFIAENTKKLRLRTDELEHTGVPGQFYMTRIPDANDPLIGRAFALYNATTDEASGEHIIDLVYLVKGKMTTAVAPMKPGEQIALWGPLGNSFDTSPTPHLIMVAGGVGQTPFVVLAREALGLQSFSSPEGTRPSGYAEKVSLCYGARSKGYLAGLEDFRNAGAELHIATEDGSLGEQGRVTLPLKRLLESTPKGSRIVCCGPEPMMQAVADIAKENRVPCQVSLETPMACGIGICFTCVAKIGCEKDWDYKRTCVEGPVFDSEAVIFD